MTKQTPLLAVSQLSKSYGQGQTRQKVLTDVSFSVDPGEFVLLLGPSGSGKSTLLNMIGGIDSPDAGTIAVCGETMDAAREKTLTEYRRRHLGYVFQTWNLVPGLTVRENIEVGAWLADDPLPVDPLIAQLGLKDHSRKMPHQLSGGQQQRVSIGRAVVKHPDLLLCDEPTGSLDGQSARQILQVLEQVCRDYGTTVLMVTHNEAYCPMADRVIRLKDGIIQSDVRNENRVSAANLEW